MKKKGKVILFVLFAFYFFITVGYAYLMENLTINGSSVIQNPTWDIHFENIQVNSGSVEIDTENEEKAATIDNVTTVSYSVSLHQPGDFYEFTVDVKNDGTIDGMIDAVSSKLNGVEITELPSYLNYRVLYFDGAELEPFHELNAGEKQTLKVKIEYKRDITEDDLPEDNQTMDLEFSVTYIQKDDRAIRKPNPLATIKPTTYDTVVSGGITYYYMGWPVDDYRSEDYAYKIKIINLSDEIDPPENIVKSWDMSAGQDGNVMAYLTPNTTDSNFYDLYLQGNGGLSANKESSFLFYGLKYVDQINNIDCLDVSHTENMMGMFGELGSASSTFTLDLGDHFDTSSATNMYGMFSYTGSGGSNFTLDLGDKFDTSNVKNMSYMFNVTGENSLTFTLDLGDKFDTGNVTDMSAMFNYTGFHSEVFALDLGDHFDTHNVTDMSDMFNLTGYYSPVFTLDLGDNFDTSNVTNMVGMFSGLGLVSDSFTLNLGDKFDTSKVEKMDSMFSSVGYKNPNFTLDLGDHFDTSNVTTMYGMFASVGYNSTHFTLDLGDKFDTSHVTYMRSMFASVGYNSTHFTLDLGDHFDTSNVTSMYGMFVETGYSSTNFSLNLGNKFYTSNVTDMHEMFSRTGYSNDTFTLDLSTFDFSGITSYAGSYNMFYGWKNTQKVYVKDAADQSWVINKNTSAFSTSNVLIKN